MLESSHNIICNMKRTILNHMHYTKSNMKAEKDLIKLYQTANNLSRDMAIQQLQNYIKMMLPNHKNYTEYVNYISHLYGHLQQMRG
jgi:hypothetical protein